MGSIPAQHPSPCAVPATDHTMMRLRQVARDNPEWRLEYDTRTESWHAYKILPNGSDDHFRHHLIDLLDLVETKVDQERLEAETST